MPLPSLKPLVAALLLSPLLDTAQAATTVNLSYNGAPNPDKNAVHVFSTNLQTLIKEKTDGEIRLKRYPNSMPDEEQECMKKLGYKCLIEVMWELMDKHQTPINYPVKVLHSVSAFTFL